MKNPKKSEHYHFQNGYSLSGLMRSSPLIPCTDTSLGLTTSPWLCRQVKYLLPWTIPSCRPRGWRSSSPTQIPGEKSTRPT